VVFADVKQAILESVIPSDSALAAALAPVERAPRRRPVQAISKPLQSRFTETESAMQPPDASREVLPVGERNRVADLDAVSG